MPVSQNGGTAGRSVAIYRFSGEARFMHLLLNRGRFDASNALTAYATAGQTSGHGAVVNAFSVAATPAATAFGPGQPKGPYPNPFMGSNVSETFTSDGPRHIFYAANGTPYTPGNFTSSGGIVRQKPDITAADGVATTVPGFQPFFGTSAAAPHAAAIAACSWAPTPASRRPRSEPDSPPPPSTSKRRARTVTPAPASSTPTPPSTSQPPATGVTRG